MEVKQWITVHPNGKDNKGQPIPIMEGQSKGEAVKAFVGKHQKEVSELKGKSIDELKKQATKDTTQQAGYGDIGNIHKMAQKGEPKIEEVPVGKWEKGSVSDVVLKWAKSNRLDSGYTRHFQRYVEISGRKYVIGDYRKGDNDELYINFKKI